MKNNTKLIMENWRKYLSENISEEEYYDDELNGEEPLPHEPPFVDAEPPSPHEDPELTSYHFEDDYQADDNLGDDYLEDDYDKDYEDYEDVDSDYEENYDDDQELEPVDPEFDNPDYV